MDKPANTLSLRPATSDDIEAVLRIEKSSYKFPWSPGNFLEELRQPQSHFLVYTDDETDSIVAGYIVFWDLKDETHILNVAVALDWRGLGMGKKLVSQAINHAYREKHKRVFLEVRTSNNGAIALYESMGFIKDHVKKSFYSDGEDAQFMMLNCQS